MQKAQGFVENGNLVVTVGGVSAAQKAQGSYPQAQVAVYNAGTLVLATIYSDNSSTAKANPFASATNGYFFFYAANGRYDVTFTGGGLSAPLTFGDVLLADPFAAGGAVTSFNGRTGAVVPVSGDYNLTQITGFPAASAPLQYLRSKATSATVFEFVNQPILLATDYTFTAQAPGGSLAIGSNTITLTPVPLGVNGTDSNHYLYVSAGTGTAEAVLITGGTAVAGSASGTVIVTCANTHSGAWTIQSATAGLSEAIWALPSAGGAIQLLSGSAMLHAPVYNRAIPMWLLGPGYEVCTYQVAADFPLTAPGVFNWTTNPGGSTVLMPGGMTGLTLFFVQPDSTNVATYTHWPPAFNIASTHRPYFQGINVQAAWDGWKSSSNDGLTVKNVTISFFHRGFDLDGQTDTVRLEDIHAWPTGLTNNQNTAFTTIGTANVLFYLGNVQDFKINGFASIAGGGPFNAHSGTGGSPIGQISNSDADTVGTFYVQDGNVEATNIQMSMLGAVDGFVINGGLLTLNGGTVFVNNGVSGVPVKVRINQSATGAAALITPGVILNGVEFIMGSADLNCIQATTAAGYAGIAECQIVNCRFDRSANIVYTTASIAQNSGTGTMRMLCMGNVFSDVSGGSVTAILLADDNNHILIGNYCGGGSFSLAGTTKLTAIGNNNALSNVNRLLDPLNLQQGTASATAGAATLSKQSGTITSEAITTAAAATYTLTLTNTLVTAASVVIPSVQLGTSTQGTPQVVTTTPGSGSVVIVIKNIHATLAFNGTIKIQFLLVNAA